MRIFPIVLFGLQVIAAIYGIYNEIAPASFPLKNLPSGMGWGLMVISATMAFTLAAVEKERNDRATERKAGDSWDRIAHRLSVYLPTHEREFYSLWVAQISTAQNNIDVTHLGPAPPNLSHGKDEGKYFGDMKKIYKASKAQIRRVERLTPQKLPWINKLIEDFRGMPNFSLKVYEDPIKDEMPAAMSVSRIDDRYAWIVAIAEHESTSNYRDLLIMGKDGVDLIRRYFQDRLWNRSITVIDHGVVNENWQREITT
jgi:hypothetical protein